MPVATIKVMSENEEYHRSAERKKKKKCSSKDTKDESEEMPADSSEVKRKKKKKRHAEDGSNNDFHRDNTAKKKKSAVEKPHDVAEEINIAKFDSEDTAVSVTNDDSANTKEKEKLPCHVIPLHFTASIFRSNLALPDKVGAELVMFSEMLSRHDERDVIGEYFKDGGSASEILEAMAQCRKSDASKCIAALSILNNLFLRSLRDFPEQLADSEECALNLLQSAGPFISNLLSPTQGNDRVKVALRLLTAMVSLSTRVAREVLRAVTFGKDEVRRLTSKDNDKSHRGVRICFLHLLLAFLVDSDLEKIQLLLVKEGMLGSAMRGLIYDKASVVHLVLTTIRTTVVENSSISKRVKQHVFNTRVLESLVLLYDWCGPQNVQDRRQRRKFRNTGDQAADPEDLQLVQQSVHDFLSLLLTSHKVGVVYASQAADTPIAKHNHMAFTALRRLHHPWDNLLKGKLLINVLKACPTLVKPTLTVHTEALIPRPTPVWLKILDYVIKVLSSVGMEEALRGSQDISTSRNMATTAESLCLPMSLLQSILVPGLTHNHAAVREGCARLLSCVLDRLTTHVTYVVQHKLLPPAAVTEMKQIISAHLVQLVPGVSIVWDAWELAVKQVDPKPSAKISKIEDSKPKPSECSSSESSSSESSSSESSEEEKLVKKKKHRIKQIEAPQIIKAELLASHEISKPSIEVMPEPARSRQLATLLALLLGYQRWLPHWVEGGRGSSRGAALLVHVRSAAESLEQEEGAKLQVQAVQLLASFDSLTIAPNQELFPWAMGLLVRESIKDETARSALRRLLTRLNLLQDNPHELDIWLWGLDEGSEHAQSLVIDALVRLARNPLEYTESQYETCVQKEQSLNSQTQQLEEMLQELTSEIQQPTDIKEETVRLLNHGLAFSPLILSAFDEERKDKESKQLLSSVLVRLLHYQSYPEPLTQLLKCHSDRLTSNTVKYLQGWVSGERPSVPSKIISSEEKSVNKFLQGDVEEVPVLTKCSSTLPRQLFMSTTYLVATAVSASILTKELLDRATQIIKLILSESSSEIVQECIGSAVSHPVLLAQFSLCCKTSSAFLCTDFLLTLAAEAGQRGYRQVLTPLRQKTLHQLNKSLVKPNKQQLLSWCKTGTVAQLLRHLQFNRSELGNVMDALVKLPQSSWISQDQTTLAQPGELAACMLQRLVELRSSARIEGVSATLVLDSQQLSLLADKLHKLVLAANETADLTLLEESLAAYLNIYLHQLSELPQDLLTSLLQREKSSTKLASLLVSHNVNLAPQLESWAPCASPKRALPLLWSLHKSYPQVIKSKTWNSMWTQLQNSIWQAVKKPSNAPEWVTQNVDIIIFLINTCLGSSEAQSQVSRLLKSTSAAENVSHACLVINLFSKAKKQHSTLACWLLCSLVQALQDENNSELVSTLCIGLHECFKTTELDLSEMQSNSLEVIKCMLRHGVGGEIELLKVLVATLKSIPVGELHQKTWDMMLSHSKFLPAMLGRNQQHIFGVLYVMETLTLMKSDLMNASHVPILLGTYQASLSNSDQIIIKLLHRYEAHGVSLHELRPLVWGEAAVSRYALRSKSTNTSLWNQPSASQALKLLDQSRIDATLARFPLDRGLADDDDSATADCDVYDPAFLLPLLCQLLAPEVLVQPWLVTRQALGICLMALCSNKQDTRQAAQLAIARLHFHFEAGRLTVEKKLWLRFLDTLRASVCPQDVPIALPPLLGLFLARATQVISQPENAMYAPLNKFLLAQPKLDTSAVPELLRLLHSSEHDHRTHRLWILSVLRDGMRTTSDFSLFSSSFAFKLLACLYNSNLADTKIKVEVLQVFRAVTKIPQAGWRLISSAGLLSWLQGIIFKLPPPPTSLDLPCDLSMSIVMLMKDIWQAISLDKQKDDGFAQVVAPSLMHSLLLMLSKLPPRFTALLPHISTLHSVCVTYPNMFAHISIAHVHQLLGLARVAGVSGVLECEDIMMFGCAHVVVNSSSNENIQGALKQLCTQWKARQET